MQAQRKETQRNQSERASLELAQGAVSKKMLASVREQIVQRMTLLLVLINENAKVSEAQSDENMFICNEHEAEGAVIARSERELTSLTRALVWLESDRGGYCDACSTPIQHLTVENAMDARRCNHCA